MKLSEVGQASGDAQKVDFDLLFRDVMTMATACEVAETKAAQERAKCKRLRVALATAQDEASNTKRRLRALLSIAARAQADGRAVDSTFLVGALWQILGEPE
jgi:hypothetical protein